MKFFSNEKESDVEPQSDPDSTQPVSSGPVSVPPQRAGSPWSDAPRDPAADTFQPERPSSDSSRDPDADISRDSDVSRDPDPDAEFVGRDGTAEQTVTTTTYGPDGSVVEDTSYRATQVGDVDDRPRDDSPVDLPLTDAEADAAEKSAIKDEGTFDEPKAVDPATGEKLDGDKSPAHAAVKDDGTFDSPQAVDPGTGETLDRSDNLGSSDRLDASDRVDSSDRVDASDRLDSEDFQPASDAPATPVAEVAAVPVAAAPVAAVPAASGSGSASGSASAARLLPDGDSFAERFRDIQLRFVDEPKEATAEAATLVGDAVDKLTSALKAQRDGLAGNSDDTEKLRVELRAYREILNRLLAL